ALRAEMEMSGERLLAADPEIVFGPGERPAVASAHADLPALWGLANAEGYSPLELQRQRELLSSARRERTAAELLGIRYRVEFEAGSGGRLRVERDALPRRRAWLASRVVPLPADQVRAAVLVWAPLPDGTLFRPYETALVEQPVPFASAEPG